MNDLFFTGTTEEKIDILKSELKQFAKTRSIKVGKIYLARGETRDIGKNLLLVAEPFTGKKALLGKDDDYAIELAGKYDIHSTFLMYCYPFQNSTTVGRTQIKEFAPWAKRIVDFLEPKLIVLLGEDPEWTFLTRKFILREHHGTIIGTHIETPIILTYPMSFYLNRANWEDSSYREHIQNQDWSFISTIWKQKNSQN